MNTLVALVSLMENVMDLIDKIKGPASTAEQLEDELVARLVRLAKRIEGVPERWKAYDAELARRIPPGVL